MRLSASSLKEQLPCSGEADDGHRKSYYPQLQLK